MKKIIVIALCLAALLCACGKEEPAPATEPAQAAAPAQTEAAPATEAATEAPTEAATEAATGAPTEAAPSAKELAQSCVDKSVEDLFALIGEPQDSEYTPSCLGDGEDGFLYYDGFTVYTYKDAEGETVSLVE